MLQKSFYLGMLRLLLLAIMAFGLSTTVKGQSGEPTAIKSIYFRGGSYFVDFEQYAGLNDFLDSIPNLQNYAITIHSHTDNVGGKEFNQMLSEMRGATVIEALLQRDEITRGMIEVKDFGLFNPVYDNSTWEGRRKNRRVDVILWLTI